MESKKILYICQEIFPYVPENIESMICRQLPQFAQDSGKYEVRIFMPCFGNINERRHQLHEVQRLSGLNIIIDGNDHQLMIKVASIQSVRLQFYFIGNETFFSRKFMDKNENGLSFEDNDERMIFYTRGVLETIKKLRWTPDIIHCHGWMTSLAPLFIKTIYNSDPFFKTAKIIYSIYNDFFSNNINNDIFRKINTKKASKLITDEKITWDSMINLAINFSDVVAEGEKGIDDKWKQVATKKKLIFLPHSEDIKTHYLTFYKDILQ